MIWLIPDRKCPVDFFHIESEGCFHLVNYKRFNYNESRYHCKQMNADLAEPKDHDKLIMYINSLKVEGNLHISFSNNIILKEN